MKKAPYSLAEAEEICKEYKYLVGQSFAKGSRAVIECVTITPFDQINKQRFLIFYFLFNSAESALAHEFRGLLFDLIVIARSTEDEHELLHEDLHTWLAEHKQLPEKIQAGEEEAQVSSEAR